MLDIDLVEKCSLSLPEDAKTANKVAKLLVVSAAILAASQITSDAIDKGIAIALKGILEAIKEVEGLSDEWKYATVFNTVAGFFAGEFNDYYFIDNSIEALGEDMIAEIFLASKQEFNEVEAHNGLIISGFGDVVPYVINEDFRKKGEATPTEIMSKNFSFSEAEISALESLEGFKVNPKTVMRILSPVKSLIATSLAVIKGHEEQITDTMNKYAERCLPILKKKHDELLDEGSEG